MSNGSVIEINDVKIELIERNKELERIRKENEELKNQMAVNYLIKTCEKFKFAFRFSTNFQSTIFKQNFLKVWKLFKEMSILCLHEVLCPFIISKRL